MHFKEKIHLPHCNERETTCHCEWLPLKTDIDSRAEPRWRHPVGIYLTPPILPPAPLYMTGLFHRFQETLFPNLLAISESLFWQFYSCACQLIRVVSFILFQAGTHPTQKILGVYLQILQGTVLRSWKCCGKGTAIACPHGVYSQVEDTDADQKSHMRLQLKQLLCRRRLCTCTV